MWLQLYLACVDPGRMLGGTPMVGAGSAKSKGDGAVVFRFFDSLVFLSFFGFLDFFFFSFLDFFSVSLVSASVRLRFFEGALVVPLAVTGLPFCPPGTPCAAGCSSFLTGKQESTYSCCVVSLSTGTFLGLCTGR